MTADFSFETQEKYKTFAGRRAKQLRTATIVYTCFIIFILIVCAIMEGKNDSLSTDAIVVGFWAVLCSYWTFLSVRRVRNYIIKLVYENGMVEITYAHYDFITRYTGKLPDFEIKNKKSFFGGSMFKADYYLKIKSFKNNIAIKQGEELDWDEQTMKEFMLAIQQPTSNN